MIAKEQKCAREERDGRDGVRKGGDEAEGQKGCVCAKARERRSEDREGSRTAMCDERWEEAAAAAAAAEQASKQARERGGEARAGSVERGDGGVAILAG